MGQYLADYINGLADPELAEVRRSLHRMMGTWRVLPGLAPQTPVTLTGTLASTLMAAVKVPGLDMGPNGALRLTSQWSTPGGSANTKTMSAKFGGQQIFSNGPTTALSFNEVPRVIQNRNSLTSQVLRPFANTGGSTSTVAVTTISVDTSVDQYVEFFGQLSNAGDTIILENYLLEVMYAP